MRQLLEHHASAALSRTPAGRLEDRHNVAGLGRCDRERASVKDGLCDALVEGLVGTRFDLEVSVARRGHGYGRAYPS